MTSGSRHGWFRMGMAMIANEEIDDKWTVGMVDDDKEIRHGWLRMGMAMIANEEIDGKWTVGMVENVNDNDRY